MEKRGVETASPQRAAASSENFLRERDFSSAKEEGEKDRILSSPLHYAAVSSSPPFSSFSSSSSLGFDVLQADSLKAVSLENGMQYSSIYWETGHRTYLPFWASLSQKFSWKIIDDQLRSLLRLPRAVTTEPFVFSSSQPYLRRYYGDADLSMAFPLTFPSRFAFVPTGTTRPWEEEKVLHDVGVQAAARRGAAATAFRAVVESAWKCDLDEMLNKHMQQQQQQQ